MASVVVHTDLNQLPGVVGLFASQLPFATAQALNKTAFDGMREEKQALRSQLQLRNTWTERGLRVEKASKQNLMARIGNLRWYMKTLVEGGDRQAMIGIQYNGARYLLVPSKEMKTGTGKLKHLKGTPFVVELNGDLLLAYRKGKARLPIQIVGRLVLETSYKRDTFGRDVVWSSYIRQHWERNWSDAMVKAVRSMR